MNPETKLDNGEGAALPCGRIFLRASSRVLLLGLLLFVPARTPAWAAGWLYLVLYAAWSAVNIGLLACRSPSLLLLRETSAPVAAEKWDRLFVYAGGVLVTLLLLVSALEGPVSSGPGPLSAAAFAGICGAYSLATWALLSNKFAAGVAVMQEGQVAADKGPYRAVRHPLYLAAIVFFICTPAALGSSAGFVPAGLLAAAVAARTFLEDRLLLKSLPGYAGYAARVPYRLLPGFW